MTRHSFVPLVLLCFSLPARAQLPTFHPLLDKLLDLAEKESSESTVVYAPACDHPPAPVALVASTREIASSTPLKLEGASFYVKDTLAVLFQTPSGKALAQQFLAQYESGKLPVNFLTKDALAFRSIRAAAFCEFTQNGKAIYIDKTQELGALAPILMHEAIHCVDPEHERALEERNKILTAFAEAAIKMLQTASQTQKKQIEALQPSDFPKGDLQRLKRLKDAVTQYQELMHFRTERKAYDGQSVVLNELIQKFPDYYSRAMRARKISHGTPSDEEIVSNYRFNPRWIAMYKSGACRPLAAEGLATIP